jgi:hypothetical protein
MRVCVLVSVFVGVCLKKILNVSTTCYAFVE